MKKKLLYILSHPIQYQSPLLKKLAQQKEIELKVFYLTNHTIGGVDKQFGQKIKWDTPLLEGYDFEFIKNNASKPAVSGSFFGLMNFGIIKKIRKENPDVVLVHGWGYFTNWLIFLFSFLIRAKLWMRSESPLNQELLKKKFVLGIKRFVVRYFIFRKFEKFLYIGKQNKAFYKYFGVKEEQLFFAPYAVDNDRFKNDFLALRNGKDKFKEQFGIPVENIVILTVGKYISKKRPLDILKMFEQLQKPNITLIFLGEGALRKELEVTIHKKNMHNVILTGFVNQSEISKYYIIADVFVLASTIGETWGLVVNEAMNFGLPIVCSDMPGSAYDLIKEGENGYVFKMGDIDDFVKKTKKIIENKIKMEEMGRFSMQKIKEFSYDKIIDNIKSYLMR